MAFNYEKTKQLLMSLYQLIIKVILIDFSIQFPTYFKYVFRLWIKYYKHWTLHICLDVPFPLNHNDSVVVLGAVEQLWTWLQMSIKFYGYALIN